MYSNRVYSVQLSLHESFTYTQRHPVSAGQCAFPKGKPKSYIQNTHTHTHIRTMQPVAILSMILQWVTMYRLCSSILHNNYHDNYWCRQAIWACIVLASFCILPKRHTTQHLSILLELRPCSRELEGVSTIVDALPARNSRLQLPIALDHLWSSCLKARHRTTAGIHRGSSCMVYTL